MSRFEIVGLTKTGGPLTKRISLTEDGKLLSDGSHCIMVAGEATRVSFDSLAKFAGIIDGMGSTKAIALGALHPRLPSKVDVRTKRKLIELNGEASAEMIARTGEHISYRPHSPGLVLVDFDSKGMPDEVRRNTDRAGGQLQRSGNSYRNSPRAATSSALRLPAASSAAIPASQSPAQTACTYI